MFSILEVAALIQAGVALFGVGAALFALFKYKQSNSQSKANEEAIRQRQEKLDRETKEEAQRLRKQAQEAKDDFEHAKILELKAAIELDAKQIAADERYRKEFYRTREDPFGKLETIKDKDGTAIRDKFTFNPEIQSLFDKDIANAKLAKDEQEKVIKRLGGNVLQELHVDKTAHEQVMDNPLYQDLENRMEEGYKQDVQNLIDSRQKAGLALNDASHMEAQKEIWKGHIKLKAEILLGAAPKIQEIALKEETFKLDKDDILLAQDIKSRESLERVTLNSDMQGLVNRGSTATRDVPSEAKSEASASNRLLSSQALSDLKQQRDRAGRASLSTRANKAGIE